MRIALFDRLPYDDLIAYKRFGDVSIHTRFSYHAAEQADIIIRTFSPVPDINGVIINCSSDDYSADKATVIKTRQWNNHSVAATALEAIADIGSIAVVGHGPIGSMVYRYLKASGRNPLWIGHADNLPPVDIITLHLKLVPETKNWLDRFIPMLHNAYIINTARRGLISNRALEMGIQRGNVRGAYLDGGPDPKIAGVIHTPHTAWIGPRSEQLRPRRVVEALERAVKILEG